MLELYFAAVLILIGFALLLFRKRIGTEEYRKVKSKLMGYVGRHEPGQEHLQKYAIEQVTFMGFVLLLVGIILIVLYYS
jgi:hypothetical protein